MKQEGVIKIALILIATTAIIGTAGYLIYPNLVKIRKLEVPQSGQSTAQETSERNSTEELPQHQPSSGQIDISNWKMYRNKSMVMQYNIHLIGNFMRLVHMRVFNQR